MKKLITRRNLLLTAGLAAPAVLLGATGNFNRKALRKTRYAGEFLSHQIRNRVGRNALAREFQPEDISPVFRVNGNVSGSSADWAVAAGNNFENWSLEVRGRIHTERDFSLRDLKALPARTQITRHDCVEGWSAIAEWTGVPLNSVLKEVRLKDDARYIVFWCADDMSGLRYYESIDLLDASHPQTILAYDMNGEALKIAHGAPIRLRVERQLGYKQAKFIEKVEVVASLDNVGWGGGGLWEDIGGYEWYAGI